LTFQKNAQLTKIITPDL